jgi:hypothetical protein
MAAHICENPSCSGDNDQGLWSEASPGKKCKTLSENELKQKGLRVWFSACLESTRP